MKLSPFNISTITYASSIITSLITIGFMISNYDIINEPLGIFIISIFSISLLFVSLNSIEHSIRKYDQVFEEEDYHLVDNKCENILIRLFYVYLLIYLCGIICFMLLFLENNEIPIIFQKILMGWKK